VTLVTLKMPYVRARVRMSQKLRHKRHNVTTSIFLNKDKELDCDKNCDARFQNVTGQNMEDIAMARKKKQRKINKTSKWAEPAETVRDSAGVPVATYCDDRGPAHALQHCHGIKVIKNPVGSRSHKVWQKQDGLDKMLQRGTITAAQFSAARRFQDNFDRAGLHGYKTQRFEMKIDGRSGVAGNNLPNDIIDARSRVMRDLRKLGGGAMATAVWYYIGLRFSLDEIVDDPDLKGNKHFWRACLLNGLSVLCNDDIKI